MMSTEKNRGTRSKILWAAAGIVLSLCGIPSLRAFTADTAPAPGKADDSFIELYRLRIEIAEASLKRQQALAELAQSKLYRGRRLLPQRAISQEEYDTLVADAAATAADIELTRKKVEEAKAYFKIIEGRVKSGNSIPLCTYEMD